MISLEPGAVEMISLEPNKELLSSESESEEEQVMPTLLTEEIKKLISESATLTHDEYLKGKEITQEMINSIGLQVANKYFGRNLTEKEYKQIESQVSRVLVSDITSGLVSEMTNKGVESEQKLRKYFENKESAKILTTDTNITRTDTEIIDTEEKSGGFMIIAAVIAVIAIFVIGKK
jgi:hypothetical protein